MGLKSSTLIVRLLFVLVFIQALEAIDIYDYGPFCYNSTSVKSPSTSLRLVFPKVPGSYPVVQFHHGWELPSGFYLQLLEHIASYGFIVSAPKLNWFGDLQPDVTQEMEVAADVLDWSTDNLASVLSPGVEPDFEKVVLVGHSRGGKVAFGLATGKVQLKSSLNYSAVVGFDPIDGFFENGKPSNPAITQHDGFNLSFPALIVGIGLRGCEIPVFSKIPCFPEIPCSPKGLNHDAFYNATKSLAFHFLAPEYGHLDFLDDGVGFGCEHGPTRKPMRSFSGGILIAFLKGVLDGNYTQFDAAFNHTSPAPVNYSSETNDDSLASDFCKNDFFAKQ